MVEKLTGLKDRLKGKVLVLGVGNILKGDDGIGPSLAKKLNGKTDAEIIDCGTAPENYTSSIRRKEPDIIVIVDAVDIKLKPGAVRIVEPKDIKDETFSTHNISLKTFADFIKTETNAEVIIIGVQPERIGFGLGLSEKASQAIAMLEQTITTLIPKKETACTG